MKILKDYKAEIAVLESHIKRHGADGRELEILEAGCGREWFFKTGGVSFRLTGVDLDVDAMEARKTKKGDLAEVIIGDLRTVQLPAGKYDVIFNSFVLEHVSGAEQVLKRFVDWLKPGGMIILRIPDRNSVQGLMTRVTPFWVHVLYHRVVWQNKNAGKPGFAPYPTVHDEVISQSGIRRFAREHGLVVREEIGLGTYARGPLLFRLGTPIFAKLVSLLTLGRIHDKFTDLTYVLEKPDSADEVSHRRRVNAGAA